MQHKMLLETKKLVSNKSFYLANAPGKGTLVAITPIAGEKSENYLPKSPKVQEI
jgi:hypothetical protein